MTVPPNALCFGSDLPGSGMPCRVEVSGAGLTLHAPDQAGTPVRELVSFSLLSVDAGGFDHDQLVVKWERDGASRTLYIKDPALITNFRQAAPPALAVLLERTARTVRRARVNRRTLLLVVAGTALAMAMGLWFGSGALVKLAVDRTPPEWEKQLGEAALKDALSGQPLLKDGPVVEAVQEMTTRLTTQIPNSPYQFSVTVVYSPAVNAFALPGGSIVVYTGLVKEARSPEEVAGVLGHEINHVLQRHGLERIVTTLGFVAVAAIVLGDQQGLIGLAERLGIEMVTLKFNRDQETEADVMGLQLLQKARVNPAGMIAFFEHLAQSEKEQQRVELLSTHPMSAGRAVRLKAELATLPKVLPEPFASDWTAVQKALKTSDMPPKR